MLCKLQVVVVFHLSMILPWPKIFTTFYKDFFFLFVIYKAIDEISLNKIIFGLFRQCLRLWHQFGNYVANIKHLNTQYRPTATIYCVTHWKFMAGRSFLFLFVLLFVCCFFFCLFVCFFKLRLRSPLKHVEISILLSL